MTGAFFELPSASIAATVWGGTGVAEREVMGERPESSQPAKKPPVRAIKQKAGSLFTKGLRRISGLPAERMVLVTRGPNLQPISLWEGYGNLGSI